MGEYIVLTGPGSVTSTIEKMGEGLMSFFQTPSGMVFAGVGMLIIFFLHKR